MPYRDAEEPGRLLLRTEAWHSRTRNSLTPSTRLKAIPHILILKNHADPIPQEARPGPLSKRPGRAL